MSLQSIPRVAGCVLCDGDGGAPVWRGPHFRVVRADEAGFPAFYRLVWTRHVAEFSDLSVEDRFLCMEAVAAIEQVLRRELRPEKINLAAFGNLVPHLHWHIVARFEDDSHFPAPVWAAAARPRDMSHENALARRMPAIDAAIAARLDAGPATA